MREPSFNGLDHVVRDILQDDFNQRVCIIARMTRLPLPLGPCPKCYDGHLDATVRQGYCISRECKGKVYEPHCHHSTRPFQTPLPGGAVELGQGIG